MTALQAHDVPITDFTKDEAAFRQFMLAFQQNVYNLALNMLQQTEDAEDITQEVFADVYRLSAKFRGEAAAGTWLYRITANKCIDLLRKKQSRQRWFAWMQSHGEKDRNDFVHPGTIAENRDKAKVLYRAMAQLPINQRTAFVLAEMENLSYRQIGEIMNLTLPAVESVVFRAKKNLRKTLSGYYETSRK